MAHINSRYTIIRVLGRGSTGSVFLVKDSLRENTVVALKTIQPSNVDDIVLRNLRDEFFTLSQFNHPSIARVYDFGTIHTTDLVRYRNNYFFTLEYVEGVDLFQFTKGQNWEIITELLYQIVQSLAYIHRHGLIHFDIKPSNFIVTKGVVHDEEIPLVKIIDFGFAAMMHESLSKPIRGTVPYLAPELIRGDRYDHRIDLYSLGATFFEIITRQLPFQGSDTTEIIKKHLTSPVPPIESYRSDIPQYISDIIRALLQKEPARRFPHAAAVAEKLHGTFLREATYRSVLATIPLHKVVGRDKEITAMQHFLHQRMEKPELASQPAVMCITGEPGIGKSPLLKEIQRRAQGNGIPFFNSQCFVHGIHPYDPLRNIVRDQVEYLTYSSMNGATILESHSVFLTKLREDDEDREVKGIQKSPSLDAKLLFFDSWAKFFCDLAVLSPYGIWLDNIENSDESTRELLMYVLRSCAQSPIAFFFTGDAESKIIHQLKAQKTCVVESLQLGPLDEKGIQEMLSISLDLDSIPGSLVETINRKIGGSPYVLREFIAHFTQNPHDQILQTIEKELDAPKLSGTFIDAVTALNIQKISDRKPEEVFIIRILSCFQTPVAVTLLELLCPFSPDRLHRFLDQLQSLGILHTVDGGHRFILTHSQFHHFVYHSLGEDARMLHALIAETMVKTNSMTSTDAEIIAYHYKNAGQFREAYTYFITAAGRKQALHALHESIALLQEACTLRPLEEIETFVFEHLAECYSLVGKYKTAVKLYQQLLASATGKTKRYTYVKALGLIHTREGNLEEAIPLLHEASELAQTMEEWIDIEEELIIIDISRGRHTEAYQRCHHALQIDPNVNDSAMMTGIINNLGIIYFYQNKYDEALERFNTSIDVLQKEGHKSKLIAPYLNMGNVYSAQERFSEAEKHWQQALMLSQEVGNLQQEARAYNNMGIAAYHQGKFDDAAHYYNKSYELFSIQGNLPGQALCLTNMGELHLASAEYELAIESWEKDLKLYSQLQDEHGLVEIYLQLAHVELIVGKTERISSFFSHASALLAKSSVTTQQAFFHFVTGLYHCMTNTFLPARDQLVKSRELYFTAQDFQGFSLSSLKLAEVERSLNHHEISQKILDEVLSIATKKDYALLQAEALMQFGLLAKSKQGSGLRAPISYFSDAYNIIEKETVSEITWKICYLLGKEYHSRGLMDKGSVYLDYANKVLTHIGSSIRDEKLRQTFFATDHRGTILSELQSLSKKTTS